MMVSRASPMAGRLTDDMRQASRHSGMSCMEGTKRKSRLSGRHKKARSRRAKKSRLGAGAN